MIVAVYNPGAHMDELVDSLLAQTLAREEWEVVFADDDSTDGSRERLQQLATEHDNVVVLHNTPNSGWPGRPRNLALDVARGTYVFFADHDDWLPADALARMVAFADEHGSDVVVTKETGHGHNWGWEAFATTKARAEIGVDPLWVPPTPHKLFRRAFLAAHGIRFPEGKVRLEDHLVITRAYFDADVISLYSDAVCYHWVHRDDGNASLQRTDPRAYYRDLDTVLDVVADNTEPGELRNRLYRQWYVVNMLRRVGAGSFLSHPPDHQERLLGEVRRITLDRFPPVMDDALPPVERARAHLVRGDRLDLLRLLAEHDVGTTTAVTTTDVHWSGDRLVVALEAVLVGNDGLPVPLVRRDGRIHRRLPDPLGAELPTEALDLTDALATATAGLVLVDRATRDLVEVDGESSVSVVDGAHGPQLTASVRVSIDPRLAFDNGPLPRLTDVSLRLAVAGWASQRRVPFPENPAPVVRVVDDQECTAYPTQGTANLTVRRAAARAPAPAKSARKTGSWPRRAVARLRGS